jgi:hypothetical protein
VEEKRERYFIRTNVLSQDYIFLISPMGIGLHYPCEEENLRPTQLPLLLKALDFLFDRATRSWRSPVSEEAKRKSFRKLSDNAPHKPQTALKSRNCSKRKWIKSLGAQSEQKLQHLVRLWRAIWEDANPESTMEAMLSKADKEMYVHKQSRKRSV